MQKLKKLKIGIIGLGYVGLPLALAFSKKYNVLGFDINKKRIETLKSGKDYNNEFKKNILSKAKVKYTNSNKELSDQDIIKIMVNNPKLIERPIVINDKKAVIGRPPEKIFDIL